MYIIRRLWRSVCDSLAVEPMPAAQQLLQKWRQDDGMDVSLDRQLFRDRICARLEVHRWVYATRAEYAHGDRRGRQFSPLVAVPQDGAGRHRVCDVDRDWCRGYRYPRHPAPARAAWRAP